MSDNFENAQVIATIDSIQTGSYFETAAGALLLYEYIITFDLEIDLCWKQKITMASVLFGANRYLPLAVAMIELPYPLPSSLTYTGCGAIMYIPAILDVLQDFHWALFSAIRAYVLSSRSRALSALVFLLSSAPLIINYTHLGLTTVLLDEIGCGLDYRLSTDIQNSFAIISRTCLMASDVLVLAITWYATYKNSREIRALGQRTSLSDILLRDGVVYFVTLLVTNVLHLALTLRSITISQGEQVSSNLTFLSDPITAILVSRFLIDLQEANNTTLRQGSLASLPSLNFDRFVGSLGSSLPVPGRGPIVGRASAQDHDNVDEAEDVDVSMAVSRDES